MSLGKRREAMRLTVAAGLDIRAESTAEVIAMLVLGAKQQAAMISSSPPVSFKVTDRMLVAMAGRLMAENRTAIERLAGVVDGVDRAMPILHRLQEAAEDTLVVARPGE